jgi:squalene-associated FAD-dependent desaturase
MAQGGAGGAYFSAVRPVHVIGAGVAGLAAACTLVEAGRAVVLHEAAKAAGGRARSYDDRALGVRIDNGNHLLLSGNVAAMGFLRRVGAEGTLAGPVEPVFPFVDLGSGERWTLRLGKGRIPWWIFSPSRRIPGTRAWDYLALLRLRRAEQDDLVAGLVGDAGALYETFLEPLAVSALNTPAAVASAAPLRAVLAETIERGGAATVPRFAKVGLSESFVDPALAWLRERGAEVRLGSRVTAIDPATQTVLAVPAWVAAELVPGLVVPDAFEAIWNAHFLVDADPGEAGFWGFVGGTAEWAFAKPGVLSVTVSAANRYADVGNEAMVARVWGDLSRAFGLGKTIPPHRVVVEKRATFAAIPAQLRRRPGTVTQNPNLLLAGDWTDTGLPATIEGAIRSGNRAALALLRQI